MSEETIFHEALAKPAAERAAFLDTATAGNPKLRAAVVALLSAHESSGNVLDQPPMAVCLTSDSEARLDTLSVFKDGNGPETVIANRYTLLERIGEGGMGEVWVAKQTEPVKRKVALKLIKKGMDSKMVLSRFEQERQALAMMDHPNIARVLDGGLTPAGQPFFVMELVNGLPLNKFCDEAKLTPRERLELFVPICQAIQHAHQKGIVHRDLKPANILVTLIDGKGVPKVIDFGVAKATHGKLTEESMNTQFGAVVGTLEYMAPEQAGYAGEDIDTRADIYSLGVILYELLTGLKPIEAKRLKSTALLEMIRVIKEVEPAKPSTRLSTEKTMRSLAALRKTEPSKLMAMLRGELDWVVMKCLEKSRDRRYETANGLARDIQRYLADQPVEARPASAGYRMQKFIHRNPLQLALAGTVALLLMGSAAVVWWQSQQAGALREANLRRQLQDEQRASAEAARLARNSEAVLALLEQGQKALEGGEVDKATVILEAAKKRSAEGGAEKEAGRIKRLDADLVLLRDLDAVDQFRCTWSGNRFPDRAAVTARTREALMRFGADPDTVSVEDAAARVSASSVRARILPAFDRVLRYQKTVAMRALLRKVDADVYRDAVRDAVFANDAAKLAELLGQKAAMEQPLGFAAFLGEIDAIPVERRRQLLEVAVTQWPSDLRLLMNLGFSYPFDQKEGADERQRWFQATVAVAPGNIAAHINLGVALDNKGQLEGAIAWYKKAIALDPKFAMAHINLGITLRKKGEMDEAIACYKKAIELDPTYALAHECLGNALRDKGQLDEAIVSFKKAIELDPKQATAYLNLGVTMPAKNQLDAAIACFKKAIELDPKLAKAHNDLGLALDTKEQFDEAIACYRKAIELDPKYTFAHNNLGSILCDVKREFDKAIACFRKAVELDPKFALAQSNLGNALYYKGQLDDAIAFQRKAIELDSKFASAHNNLGLALAAKKQFDEAITCYRKALELDPNSVLTQQNLGLALQGKRKVDIHDKLPAYLKGEFQPTTNDDRIALGEVCRDKKLYYTATTLYAAAIAADPKAADELWRYYRYNAACYAARASSGQGGDTAKLDDQARTHLRKEVLNWLRTDLGLRNKQLESDKPADRSEARRELLHWQKDEDLASIRDASALSKLPPNEKMAFAQLWADVAKLLK